MAMGGVNRAEESAGRRSEFDNGNAVEVIVMIEVRIQMIVAVRVLTPPRNAGPVSRRVVAAHDSYSDHYHQNTPNVKI